MGANTENANDKRIKELLSKRLEQGVALGDEKYKDLIAESRIAYQTVHKTAMPDMRQAILAYTIDQMAQRLMQQGIPAQYIKDAVEDIGNVQNPISMMFALIGLIVPNFAYMDACAVQPMPTETSPVFFQNLMANTTRNGITQGDALLGGTTWNNNNLYSANRNKEVLVGSGTPWTLTPAYRPLLPGKIRITSASGLIVLKDDGNGGLTVYRGTITLGAVTISYGTATSAGSISVAATGLGSDTLDGATVDYRYDMDAGGYDPAQVLYEWSTKPLNAQPRRLRTLYGLQNYYAAKQVLKGVDIDSLLDTSVGGLINKEISCGVFDDMFDERQASAPLTWNKNLPSGVSWAFHRLSLLQPFVEGSNQLRKNIARWGGNVVIAGNEWMNWIETIGNDLWTPNKYPREPIGPYVAGTLNNKFTVIKNQQYGDNEAIMAGKADDTDASYIVGVFIALYNTDPIALDDLKVRRGIGTSLGSDILFPNSIIELQVVDQAYT